MLGSAPDCIFVVHGNKNWLFINRLEYYLNNFSVAERCYCAGPGKFLQLRLNYLLGSRA